MSATNKLSFPGLYSAFRFFIVVVIGIASGRLITGCIPKLIVKPLII